MTAPLFYVDALPDSGPLLITGDEARHAQAAMRLGSGEAVLVGDGHGGLAEAVVVRADRRRGLEVSVIAARRIAPARPLTVVQAVPKGERADLAVELLTEAGASAIVPWLSQRTIPDWRHKTHDKHERWQRVARSASKQARRPWITDVRAPVVGTPALEGAAFVLHESAEHSLYDVDPPAGALTVVVGPEGGLSEAEVAALAGAGARAVRMGPEIMRTSTAGAAACVWLRGLEMRLGS